MATGDGNRQVPSHEQTISAIIRSIPMLQERWPTQVTTTTTSFDVFRGYKEVVDFPIPDTIQFTRQVFLTCFKKMSLHGISDLQRCAFFTAALNCMFPDLSETFKSTLKDRGGNVREVKLPSQSSPFILILDPDSDQHEVLICFAQMVIILYKNLSSNRYINYMKSQISAIKAHVGMPFENNPTVAISEQHAVMLRSILSCSIRKDVLLKLIDTRGSNTTLAKTCSYLCTLVEWTDMAPMVLIRDTLMATNSPVLKDLRVRWEVVNLATAFAAVNAHRYPQYFRVLSTGFEHMPCLRAKFPTLIAVAQKIRNPRFATPSQIGPKFVDELVMLHHSASRASTIDRVVEQMVNFNMSDVV